MDSIGLNTSSCTSGDFNLWSTPERIQVNDYSDRIEFIYKQMYMITLTIYPSPPPEERVFKIVFSCKEGKWHKSEPIYGKILPAQDEQYEFED